MPEGLQFAHPGMLYGLLLLPLYGAVRYWLTRRRALAYPPLQFRRLPLARRMLPPLAVALELLLMAAAVAGLAGPQQVNQWIQVRQEGVDIALLLDISASMQAADFPPTRLEALKKLSSDFIRQGGTNRLAVYVFAKDVFTQTPLTTDHQILLPLIQGISLEMINHVVSGGTAIGDVLLMATDMLARNRIKGRDQVLILITDGESNAGVDPLLAARYVREEGVRLYLVGLGQDEPVKVFIYGQPFINTEGEHLTTKLDDAQLKDIARVAGGRYFRADRVKVLAAILQELGRLETGPIEIERRQLVHSWAPLPAMAALLCFGTWLTLAGFGLRRPLR